MSTCWDCMYLDHNDTEGTIITKYWCGHIRRYVRSNTPACAAFMQRTTNCYLTTACVHYMGLEDNCEELSLLRKFRDEYMIKTDGGKEKVEMYYSTAPMIVEAIDKRDDRREIYDYIYQNIKLCVDLIKKGENEKVAVLYEKMVMDLNKKINNCDGDV